MTEVIEEAEQESRRCGRCDVELERVDHRDPPSQILNGLQIYAEGYYGGFWDTLSFMGEGPVDISLCHDCCIWLCDEIPVFAMEADGGHGFNPEDPVSPQERCCDYAFDWNTVPKGDG
jgi:hypothetical protein|tara:strand:- start:5141 stop:5494 length:354 start_codon:yes stop_codon:yes gene_type:complete